MADFGAAFAWLIQDEGGFINDPEDPGGPTKFGITLQSLTEWRGRATPADVEALTFEDARAFYRQMYWDPMSLDACASDACATCILDLSVLVGRRRGILAAQAATGTKEDGSMGPVTLAAINAAHEGCFVAEMTIWVATLLVRRTAESPTTSRFLAGWMARCFRLFRLAVRPISAHPYTTC